jgi:hypothetical protein
MIIQNLVSCHLRFHFDFADGQALAGIDSDEGWSIYYGDEAVAIYEFVTKYIDLPAPDEWEFEPPDETK